MIYFPVQDNATFIQSSSLLTTNCWDYWTIGSTLLTSKNLSIHEIKISSQKPALKELYQEIWTITDSTYHPRIHIKGPSWTDIENVVNPPSSIYNCFRLSLDCVCQMLWRDSIISDSTRKWNMYSAIANACSLFCMSTIDNTIEVDNPLFHSNKVNFSDYMNII